MIEVVGMVYRSPDFLRFLKDQKVCDRIVGNDPAPEVMDMLPWNKEGHIYFDRSPSDHYLSRVYRCWNYCVESSSAEYVCLVHTDMAFSPGWLDALERRLDGKTLPCSRMVEPGHTRKDGRTLTPGKHAVHIDIGRDPETFPMEAWFNIAADLSDDRVERGGLFGCPVIHRQTFSRLGGFPHGNVTRDGNVCHHSDWMRESRAGNLVSGDAFLFERMGREGFQHVTCFDSLVYHMQEGEMGS